MTPDGSSGLRILAAPKEDADEGFSASRLLRGQLPSVLPQQPAHTGCQNGIVPGVCMLESFGVSKRHPDSNFKRQERTFMSWAVL